MISSQIPITKFISCSMSRMATPMVAKKSTGSNQLEVVSSRITNTMGMTIIIIRLKMCIRDRLWRKNGVSCKRIGRCWSVCWL